MIISEKHEFVFGILIGLFAGALLIVIMDYFGVDNKSSGIVPLLILDVCSIVHARS
jgi:fructose-specific phosphotransferase system IIC component